MAELTSYAAPTGLEMRAGGVATKMPRLAALGNRGQNQFELDEPTK